MTIDPVAHTLASVLDTLRRQTRRERTVGDLVANASWWTDTCCGTALSSSAWALVESERALDHARLTEAPYLSAVGYLADLGLIAHTEALADAATKVTKRAAHTAERTGYADDPLVLAGLWLLGRRLRLDVRTIRQEAVALVGESDTSPAVSVLLCLIDESLCEACRPFAVRDATDVAIAVAVVPNVSVAARLFPSVTAESGPRDLMTAACAGELTPAGELDSAYAAIGLARAIAMATQRSAGPTADDAEPASEAAHGGVQMTVRNPDRAEGNEFPATVVFVVLSGIKDCPDGSLIPRAMAALHSSLRSLDPGTYVLSTIAGAIVVIPDEASCTLHDVFSVLHNARAGFPLRVGVTHGNIEVVADIDGQTNLIGPMINTGARLATATDNPGALIHETYANHVGSTLPATHWLHRSRRRETTVRGKPQDRPFRCFVAPDAFDEKSLEETAEYKWRSAALIAYDLPKFSGGDRSELRKRFTRLAHVFKRLRPTQPLIPAELSPGGDGGVVALSGVSLAEAAAIAVRLRTLTELESLGHARAIAVKVRVGVHYGRITEYQNARGILRPTGLELFAADEIAGDDIARAKNDIIVTGLLAESIAGGSHEQLAAAFEELPPLDRGPAAGIPRFLQRTAPNAGPEAPVPPPSAATSDIGESPTGSRAVSSSSEPGSVSLAVSGPHSAPDSAVPASPDLAQLLAALPVSDTYHGRSQLLDGISLNLHRSESLKLLDLRQIVSQLRARRLPNGQLALVTVIDNALGFSEGTDVFSALLAERSALSSKG